MSQWYYSESGQQAGPVSSEQLKQLATSGQLQASDLVWKDGMGQWVEARKIKGLFPQQAVRPPQLPPTVPPVPPVLPQQSLPPLIPSPLNIPSIPIAVAAADQSSLSSRPGAVPALWNPQVAGLWSVLLSWAFGSFLLARNWEALGNPARAKRCMLWFYAVFPWAAVFALLLYLTPIDLNDLSMDNDGVVFLRCLVHYLVPLIPMFVWAFVEVKPQAKFIKDNFGDRYYFTYSPVAGAFGDRSGLGLWSAYRCRRAHRRDCWNGSEDAKVEIALLLL